MIQFTNTVCATRISHESKFTFENKKKTKIKKIMSTRDYYRQI